MLLEENNKQGHMSKIELEYMKRYMFSFQEKRVQTFQRFLL
jgi:hypothetical protein